MPENVESIVNEPVNYTLKVLSVSKEHSQSDDKDVLKVEFGIYRPLFEGEELPDGGDKVQVEIRILAFDLEASKEDIEGSLKKYIDLYNEEARKASQNKSLDEANKNVVKLKENLEGLSL